MLSRRQAGMLFFLWLGCSVVISQTFFFRELLNIFSGNEFSLGIMFSVWLLASALGAACGDRLNTRSGFCTSLTLAGALLLAPLLPLTLIAIQAYRALSGLPPDVSLSPGQVVLASLLLLSLPAFLHGLLFPLACLSSRNNLDHSKGFAGQGYAIESIGSLIGGLLAAFLLIPFVRPIPAMVGTALACLGVVALLACSATLKKRELYRGIWMITLMAVGLLTATLSGGLSTLERRAVSAAYPYATVLYSGSTRYQKLTLLALGGQHTFMASGTPLLTLPHPDDGNSEATAMIPLMAVERPKTVLILGGLDSLPRRVTALSSIKRIDCLEADPGLLDALNLIPEAKRLLGFNDPRLSLIREDPRKWLARAQERYDVVLVSLPPPATLASSRFYSVEFYRQISRLLADDGIVAIVLPGSETYLTIPLEDLLASVSGALKEALPFTLAVPGDSTLLLGSRLPLDDRLNPAFLASRLLSRGVQPQLLTAAYLEDRLSPERLSWLRGELARSAAPSNRDNAPQSTWYSLVYQMEQHGGVSGWWGKLLSQRGALLLLAGLLLIATALPGLFSCNRSRTIFLGTMAGTGFTAMALEILLMLAYQSHTGLIYQGVALFTSAFMAGSALGVFFARRWESRVGPQLLTMIAEAGLLLLNGMLAVLFLFGLSATLVAAMPIGVLLGGLLTGMEFQAINRIIAGEGEGSERPGLSYAADLLGACLGGVLAGMVLIPLAGFGKTCAILASMKALQLVILIMQPGRNGRQL